MRRFIFTAATIGLVVFSGPAAAEHLYSNGQPPHGLQGYGAGWQNGYPPAPGAQAVPRRFDHARDRLGPRTGLDRPYGGHGVPYRTPPQGWPNPPI